MGSHFVVGVVLAYGTVLSAGALPAQSAAAQASAATTVDKPISLSGCVEADRTDEGFTLSDKRLTYRPRATDLRLYAGQPVPLVGGLLPTPNIAAQAGSIDHTIALMATTGVNLGSNTHLRVVRRPITRVRPLRGSCPPQ